MNYSSEEHKSVAIIRLNGEMRLGTVGEFETMYNSMIVKKLPAIALDCSCLQFIDSSAIGTLVKFLHLANSKKIKLVLFDMNDTIQSIFRAVKLDSFFTIMTKVKFEKEYNL